MHFFLLLIHWVIVQNPGQSLDMIAVSDVKVIYDPQEPFTLSDIFSLNPDSLQDGRSALFHQGKAWIILPGKQFMDFQSGYDLSIIGMTDEVTFHFYEEESGWSRITTNRLSNTRSEDHFYHPTLHLENISFDQPIVLEIQEGIISLIAIEKRNTKYARHEIRNIVTSAILGVLLFIVSINLFRGIQSKELVYFVYALYVSFNMADISSFEGSAVMQFFGFHNPTLRYNIILISILLFNVLGAWYGIVFLRLRTTNQKYYRAMLIYLGVVFLSVIVLLFDTTYISYITNLCIAALAGLLCLAGISQWRKGYHYVGYYVVGYFLFALITAYYTYNRVIDPTYPYTTIVPLYYFGFLVEAIFLNISLNYRIYFEKSLAEKEKEQTQKELIEYQLQQNLVLEERVAERTSKLQEALDNLKQTQSQLIESEKLASLGILSAGVSHEINNPLNFIKGGIDGLGIQLSKQEVEVDEDTNQFIQAIQEGVKRATTIVKSLSHFSRTGEDLNEQCHIHQTLDNCLVILAGQLKHKIQIHKQYCAEDIVLKGNEGRLHQAFLNILLNASQAIPDTGTITIKTSRDKQTFLIEISDTGMGIPNEALSKILLPFYTTKAPGEGTGLGLSITHNIIEEHGGTIEIDSTVGKGTTFKISIPY